MATNQRHATWLDDIITSLRNLSGIATVDQICTEIEQRRQRVVIPPGKTLTAVVYQILSNHSSDAENYSRKFSDIFYAVDGSRWGLRGYPADPFVVHYALDLETPPLIACDSPDAVKYTTVAAEVTCPDCMTHEEFPRNVTQRQGIRPYNVLMSAADLLSDEGENYEYDRAIVELTSALLGADPDDNLLITRILRALKEGE